MSSSKVFKTDTQFTATPLVQHNIAALEEKTKKPNTGLKPSSSPAPAASPSPPPDPSVKPKAKAAEPEQVPKIDIEGIKKEAYEKGKKDQAAQQDAHFQEVLQTFAQACQKIDSQRKVLLLRSREESINLIIAFTQKILNQELTTPRNVIAATLEAVLKQIVESEEFYITLHPDDLTLAEEKAPEIIASIRGLERIGFKTDKNLTRGGCLLESTDFSIDATIETQMERAREFLEEQSDSIPTPEME